MGRPPQVLLRTAGHGSSENCLSFFKNIWDQKWTFWWCVAPNVLACCLLNLHFGPKISSSVSDSREEWPGNFCPKEPWEQADPFLDVSITKFPCLCVTFFSSSLPPCPQIFLAGLLWAVHNASWERLEENSRRHCQCLWHQGEAGRVSKKEGLAGDLHMDALLLWEPCPGGLHLPLCFLIYLLSRLWD